MVAIGVAVALIVFSVFLHELAHALCMRKYGINIATFSIGLPFPIAVQFCWEKIFNGAVIQITPLLFGAYVKPTRRGEIILKSLPYSKQADIYGAGILANVLFAIFLFGVYWIMTVDVRAVPAFVGVVSLYLVRKIFYRWLSLPLGWFMLFLTASVFFQDPTRAIIGPVGIVQMIGEYAIDLRKAILVAAVVSLGIGLTNVLPLFPFDGGRIMASLIGAKRQCLQGIYNAATGLIAVLLLIVAIVTDFLPK